MTPPREEWNDRAVDGLNKRVDDLSIELDIVRRLPQAVARVDERTEALEQDAARLQRAAEAADAREERRIRELRSYVDRRLDERPTPRASWGAFLLAFMGTVVVPLAGALIAGYFVMKAAGL
jgi:hypothetical protein